MFDFSVCFLKAFFYQICQLAAVSRPLFATCAVHFHVISVVPLHPMVAVRMKKCHIDQFVISACRLPRV